MLTQIRTVLPALRVHSWGGFGSQLFTAYIILKVQNRYPGRRIKVVVHTSGVTRRFSEFNFEQLGTKVIQVEDYRNLKVQSYSRVDSFRRNFCSFRSLRQNVSQALNLLRVIQFANSDESFHSIMPWTLSLRGHYTRISLNTELIHYLYQILFEKSSFLTHRNHQLIVHYRLGDLLHLQEKSPIKPNRIEKLLLLGDYDNTASIVLSDSSEREFRDFVSGYTTLSSIRLENLEPLHSLWLCINSETFIGTGTKLSLWAAIFRNFINDNSSFLPVELDWIKPFCRQVNWY
jgi:hypothetical protein